MTMRRILLWLAILVVIFVAAPLMVVVPMSFTTSPSLVFPPPGLLARLLPALLPDPNWTGPTINSFIVGLGTTVLTMCCVYARGLRHRAARIPLGGAVCLNIVICSR